MDHLTSAQQSAVTFDRRDPKNLLILACAGSGKTETLACREAQMVVDGIDRSSIAGLHLHRARRHGVEAPHQAQGGGSDAPRAITR